MPRRGFERGGDPHLVCNTRDYGYRCNFPDRKEDQIIFTEEPVRKQIQRLRLQALMPRECTVELTKVVQSEAEVSGLRTAPCECLLVGLFFPDAERDFSEQGDDIISVKRYTD